MIRTHILLLSVCTLPLAGCGVPFMAGAAATGAYIGLQEKGARNVVMDTKLKVAVKERLTAVDIDHLLDIGVTVFEGDVLLTGVVPKKDAGLVALETARGTSDVKRVYNELFVGEYTAAQQARDLWIATQYKARLMGNRDTFPLNYTVTTVHGHVYIMGYVASDGEHRHVLHVLRTTPGVQKVHDYLRLSVSGDDPRREKLSEDLLEIEPAPSLPES